MTTTWMTRFREALTTMVGAEPPLELCEMWVRHEQDANNLDPLQSWVLAQKGLPAWAQGIETIDAADAWASNPEEGEDHEDHPTRSEQSLSMSIARFQAQLLGATVMAIVELRKRHEARARAAGCLVVARHEAVKLCDEAIASLKASGVFETEDADLLAAAHEAREVMGLSEPQWDGLAMVRMSTVVDGLLAAQ